MDTNSHLGCSRCGAQWHGFVSVDGTGATSAMSISDASCASATRTTRRRLIRLRVPLTSLRISSWSPTHIRNGRLLPAKTDCDLNVADLDGSNTALLREMAAEGNALHHREPLTNTKNRPVDEAGPVRSCPTDTCSGGTRIPVPLDQEEIAGFRARQNPERESRVRRFGGGAVE